MIKALLGRFSNLIVCSTSIDSSLLLPKGAKKAERAFLTTPFPPPTERPLSSGYSEKDWKKLAQQRDIKRAELCSTLDLPEKSLLLLSLSPIVVEQSLETIVRALADVDKKIYLIIAADGPDRDRILSLIVGLGLTEQIVLLGQPENATNLVYSVDVLIVPKAFSYEDPVLDAITAGTGLLLGGDESLLDIVCEEDQVFDPEHVGELSLKLKELSGRKSALEENMKASVEAGLKLNSDWVESIKERLKDLEQERRL